jgi:hypothetical protein
MKQSLLAAALAATLGLMSSSAVAGLIVTTGNNPQTDDNVIANGCSAGVAVPGPALTVKGCFNANHDQPVDFTSNEAITYTGGQATVEASDGAFATLTISVEGATFDTLILNIDAIKQRPTDLASKISFTDGVTTSALFALSSNGQNFFTLTGGPFNFITFNVFQAAQTSTALQDVVDVKQVRIGGWKKIADPVPEPGTVALLGAGLIGLGFVRSRRKAP